MTDSARPFKSFIELITIIRAKTWNVMVEIPQCMKLIGVALLSLVALRFMARNPEIFLESFIE